MNSHRDHNTQTVITPHHKPHDSDHDDPDEEHAEHVDERWLVSYADMMTLLFGLFVMLYSIAIEHKGNVNATLSKIAESRFRDADKPVDPAKIPGAPIVTEAELAELHTRLQVAEQKVLEKTNTIEDLKAQIQSKNQTFQAESRDQESILLRFEKVQNELSETKRELEHFKSSGKGKKIKSQINPSIDLNLEIQKQATRLKIEQNTVAQLKTRIQDLELQAQAQSQAVKSQTETLAITKNKLSENEDLRKEVNLLKSEQTRHISELNQKDQEIESLKKQVADTAPNLKFLMFSVRWTTLKHDLDMTVEDPTGKLFSFKNRSFKGSDGKFTLDSRSGPGAEMWQTKNLIPGTYKITIKPYQSYGNEEPAEVVFSATSFRDTFESGTFKMEFQSKKPRVFRFHLGEDGKFKKSE